MTIGRKCSQDKWDVYKSRIRIIMLECINHENYHLSIHHVYSNMVKYYYSARWSSGNMFDCRQRSLVRILHWHNMNLSGYKQTFTVIASWCITINKRVTNVPMYMIYLSLTSPIPWRFHCKFVLYHSISWNKPKISFILNSIIKWLLNGNGKCVMFIITL